MTIVNHDADSRGHWMQAWDGSKIWPIDPRIGDLSPIVIAQSLARVNRFGGHLKVDAYSVAQHSVIVSLNCEPKNALAGLLHDAHEAVLGDWVSPVKWSLPPTVQAAFRDLERRWQWAIGCTFGLADALVNLTPDVRMADLRALWTERRDLLAPGPAWEGTVGTPFDEVIEPWPVERSVREWMDRFHLLAHGIGIAEPVQFVSGGAL